MKIDRAENLSIQSDDRPAWRRVRVGLGLGTCVTALAILVCVFWIDLPLASYVHESGIDSQFHWLRIFINFQAFFTPIALVYMLVYIVRRSNSEMSYNSYFWFVTCVGTFVTCEIKNMFKILFGRTWPRDTSEMIMDIDVILPQMSSRGYVNDGIHLFKPFAAIKSFTAFPSGTMCVFCAVAIPVCMRFPSMRIPIVLWGGVTVFSLIQSNTHFLSDVLAGAYLGAIVGMISFAVILHQKDLLRK